MTKQCIRCEEEKDLSMFDKGYRYCKVCRNVIQREKDKSKTGVIKRIYNEQLKSSRKRGHKTPDYSCDALIEYVTSQSNYTQMYESWVDSGFDKKMRPSIDRKDSLLPYRLDNIELVIWSENLSRAHKDMKVDKLKTGFDKCAVYQYTMDGAFVCGYISQLDASRSLGIGNTDISKAILGVSKQAGGFQWKTYMCEKGIKKVIAKKHVSVQMCDKLSHVVLKEYDSILDAATDNNIHKSNISACIRGVYASAGGYVWKKITNKEAE